MTYNPTLNSASDPISEPRSTALWAILALGVALRILWAVLMPVEPVSDSHAYWSLAQNIVTHGVYGFEPDVPSAYWAVGTAALYAGGYMLFGADSDLSVILINMISSIAVIVLLYDVGRRWFGARAGLAAAALFAIWPLAIQFSSVLASEIHFMALSLGGLAAWDRAGFRPRGLVFLVLAGLCLGAATYLRPIALLIPAALAAASVLRAIRLSWQDCLKAVVATALIFALVAPWSARNERVFGEPVMMSTNFWANFWMGNNPETSGGYMPLPEVTRGLTEIERAHLLEEISLGHLRDEGIAAFAWRTLWKAARLHERETIGVAWNQAGVEALVGGTGADGLKLLSTAYWYAMLALALAGIVLLARRGLGWRVILAPPVWLWLYFTGVHAVIVVGDRYHMPAIPMIALLAGVAVAAWLDRPTDRV